MPMNPENFVKMSRLLLTGASVPDVVQETGIHRVTVTDYLKKLYDEQVTYIYDWGYDKRGNPSIRIYRFRTGKDDKDMLRPVSAETFYRYPEEKRAPYLE